MTTEPPTGEPLVPEFEVFSSRQLTSWLGEAGASLALTSRGTCRLVLVNIEPDGKLKAFQRIFDRTTGLWADGQTLYLATLYQLWRFENVLAPGERTGEGEDRLYVPMAAFTTGDVHARDVAVDGDGRPLFASSLFDCLARPSPSHSFEVLWRPPFVADLAPADRCHLTGVALVDGRPAYVTCAGRGVVDWRRQADGGVVVDVQTGAVVAEGLCLPRSPRWIGDRLWLLNAGTGELGHVDLRRGRFEPVALCPGYPRGLAVLGGHAIVGTAAPRPETGFGSLPLGERLWARRAEPRCGLTVVNLRSGDTVHWLRLEGQLTEVADVAVLPGVRRPTALGLRTDEIRRTLRIADPAPLVPAAGAGPGAGGG